MKRVIELIRVSTESQAASDRASIPAQRAVNRRTAAAYGLSIVRSIEMADVSGAAVLMAPEIRELISLISDREIHGVVAREFSRLMRPENFSDYALLQTFADSNTILYLPEGPIDFSSKTGRLLGTIRAAIAGMERTEILERVWSAKEEKRRAGGFAQSPICLPFGVSFNGGKWSYTADAELVRETFRQFLSGQTSYRILADKLGVSVPGLRCILHNPIYTGWRVIDKKRDTSAAGKYPTKNGRQGERRKVQRQPDEVIRVKVLEPLISQADFDRIQALMDLKRANHWRTREDYEHRYTYNGYLSCTCGSLVYTKFRRDDYYVCRDRCGVGYMRRDRLEPHLNSIFSKCLSSVPFLKQHVIPALSRNEQPRADSERLQDQLQSLETKRQRILDTYYESVITKAERDEKLNELDRQRSAFRDLLAREQPVMELTAERLADLFAPFVEFDLLNRSERRELLNILAPSITVANYNVKGLWISRLCSDKETHTDTDS